MKILHAADWHLDAPLQGHGESLRQALAAVPGKLLELCRQESCDLVLLAGDLFDGVYTPYAEEDGEYFTVPLKFAETKIPGANYSDISGKPIEFTMEMLDGDAYGYWWYIDNTQQVEKRGPWISATTGTAKNTVGFISLISSIMLLIKLQTYICIPVISEYKKIQMPA